MLTAVVLIVGAVVAWLLADRWLLWRREREGTSAWRGRGPGTVFHSTGFEDTVPPHEVVERYAQLKGRQG
jgi:preprotein translocase subunit SecG